MSVSFDYQGFDILSQWDGALTSANALAAYAAIAAAGSTAVGLSPILFVASRTTSTLVTDAVRSTSDSSLIAGIQAAQAQGLKVLLEPHIAGLDGTASYAINPTNTAAFFASYKAAIVHLATIAQATGVDTLSLGDEMSTLTGSAYRARWLDIIGAVRAVYSGKITYEAATNEASSVSFWDKVDIIGFNAYLSLSASANPSVADLEKAWTTPPADNYWASVLNGQSVVDFMHSLATTYGKQVLITEVGYRSIDGAATNPGQSERVGTADNTDQAKAYQALFQVLQSQGGSWFAGLQVWEYTVGLSNTATDYSPVGKPAMAIIQQYFSGAGAVAGLTITGSAVNDLIDVGNGDDVIKAGLGNDVIKVGAGNDTIVAGPAAITTRATTTVTVTGYGNRGQIALLLNGQQVGASVTFTPAADTSGYQTYSFTFTNPDRIRSLDVALLNGNAGGNAMIRSITINGAALGVGDVSNAGAPGTFNLYTKTIHLDAAGYQDWFYGAQSDDDLIYAGTGRDTIDGGAGLDTVVFADKASDYTLTRAGSILTVTDVRGTGNDTAVLTNVDFLQFADRTVAVARLIVPGAASGAPQGLAAPLLTAATLISPKISGAPTLIVTGLSAGGAKVSLAKSKTTLATTTADASTGAYRFSVAGLADGLYGLSVSATLGALTSAASATTTLAVGSAADIVPILLGASTTPSAVYVTDPADTIAVSIGQLRAITPALVHAVTGYSLAVTDTGAHVVGAIDLLATQANLSSITLTDGPALAVSLSTMRTLIANDGAVLGKIVGGYSFVVSGTGTNGALTTTHYDSTGAMTSSQTVTTTGGVTETYLRNADGSTSDSFADAAGTLLSQTIRKAAGTRYAVYGITGKPYAAQVVVVSSAGTLTQLTRSYANGSVYSAMTVATDGTTTTNFYDASASRTQKVIVRANGTTETFQFDANDAVISHKIADATGKRLNLYGLTGKPYSSQTFVFGTTGKLTQLVERYADGTPFLVTSVAADGTSTTSLYDTTGTLTQRTERAADGTLLRLTTVASDGTSTTTLYDSDGTSLQRVIAKPDGSTETLLFDDKGDVRSDTIIDSTGKRVTRYGIADRPYVSQTLTYDKTGTVTGVVDSYADGTPYLITTVAADGTATTTLYDTDGHRTQKMTTDPDGATQTALFDSSGFMTSFSLVDDTGKRTTLYGITGKPYASQTFAYDTAGKLTQLVDRYADGSTYLVMTVAPDGSSITTLYDTDALRTQKVIASPDGTIETIFFAASGAKTSDVVVDDTGKHTTHYEIQGKPYSSMLVDQNQNGDMTDIRLFNTNGTTTTTFYASGVSLDFTGPKDTIVSFGGDTMRFASTPFNDTIQSFHGGIGANHDTIVLSKALASAFDQLSIVTSGAGTTVSIDSRHALTLTGLKGTFGAANVQFV